MATNLPPVMITKRLEFDAGHRLLNHESKCFNVHGHRWAVEVTCSFGPKRDGLDKAGRVTDFGNIKTVFGKWLDDTLDHTYIANDKDPLLGAIQTVNTRPVYVVPFEPSSENLAEHLAKMAQLLMVRLGVRVVELALYETPTSKAVYRLAEDWEPSESEYLHLSEAIKTFTGPAAL